MLKQSQHSSDEDIPLSSVDLLSLRLSSTFSGGDKVEKFPSELMFRRMNVPIYFVHDMSSPAHREVRRLAELPAPALLHIQSDLGRFIAKGGSGIVYEIDTPATVYDARGRKINIPPLVCKFAGRARKKALAREAWVYDELQTIQGVAIPRCFGLFEATLPDDCDFVPWIKESEYDSDSSDEYNSEEYYESQRLGTFEETPVNREILRRLEDPRCVVMLLLERLGGPFLPIKTHISDEIKNDAHAAYDVLAEIGFEHLDVRLGNILHTFDSPLALPGIPSPIHGRVLKCRIVDFELSRKVTGFKYLTEAMYKPLDELISGLPDGDIRNQQL